MRDTKPNPLMKPENKDRFETEFDLEESSKKIVIKRLFNSNFRPIFNFLNKRNLYGGWIINELNHLRSVNDKYAGTYDAIDHYKLYYNFNYECYILIAQPYGFNHNINKIKNTWDYFGLSYIILKNYGWHVPNSTTLYCIGTKDNLINIFERTDFDGSGNGLHQELIKYGFNFDIKLLKNISPDNKNIKCRYCGIEIPKCKIKTELYICDKCKDIISNHYNIYGIYFYKSGFSEHIKIGFSSNIKMRMKSFRTSHAGKGKLLLTIPGNMKNEYNLHKSFKEYKHGLEWFKYEGKLKIFVETIIKEHEEEYFNGGYYETIRSNDRNKKTQRAE